MKLQRNPDCGKHNADFYTNLGWQRYDYPEVVACKAAGHKRREHDNSTYMHRGTDIMTICDTCKYVYHIDMSG